MARDELQVIDRTYELLKWFLARLAKFPRSHRYGLGRTMEDMNPQIAQIAQIARIPGKRDARPDENAVAQVHAKAMLICENLRNLWTAKRMRR